VRGPRNHGKVTHEPTDQTFQTACVRARTPHSQLVSLWLCVCHHFKCCPTRSNAVQRIFSRNIAAVHHPTATSHLHVTTMFICAPIHFFHC
jgi:hypothetical protein